MYNTFSMLNSAEHEIYPAYKYKMPTFVGILTFVSMINTASERLKTINLFISQYFGFYEHLKFLCPVELSMKKGLLPRAQVYILNCLLLQ